MDFSQSDTNDSLLRQSTSFCRLSFFCGILLPYIPFPMRQPLLLFTKFLELRECMSCPKRRFDFGNTQEMKSADIISEIFNKLTPILSEQESSMFYKMQNMMQMLKIYQTIQEFAPLMNMEGTNLNAEGSPSETGMENSSNVTDMLFSMLSPEQKEMFENLKSVMTDPPAE